MASSPEGRELLGLHALVAPDAVTATTGLASPPTHVVDIVTGRCSMCHASQPVWAGIQIAPKNVLLDSPEAIARQAAAIRTQVVMSHAMPPNNVTELTLDERAQIKAWVDGLSRSTALADSSAAATRVQP